MSAPMLPGIAAEARAAPPPRALRTLRVFVAGEPKPMGSKTAFVVNGAHGPRAVVTDGKSGKAMRSWKDSVIAAVQAELGSEPRMLDAVRVTVEFRLARPTGHRGADGRPRRSAPRYPAVKPDLDKLCRSTLDALTVGLLGDDSRVVELVLSKRYADEGPTGAAIRVEELA